MSQFSSRIIRATRIEHQCHGCLAVVPVGSRVQKSAGVNSGDFWAIVFCSDCSDWLDAHHDFWEAYPDGCLPAEVGDARAALAGHEEAPSA